MNLFSLFSSNKLKPAWQFSAANILWRVMFSENGLIVGEDRNTETKSVEFFCLNAVTGKPLWQNKTFDEQWWIGLDAITNERLYLHGFGKPSMPEHKNIIAAELQTGNVLWRNSECTFLAIQSPFVFGYKDLFERRVYYKMNDNTGEILEELALLPDGVEPNIQYEKTDFLFPQVLSQENEELWGLVRRGAMRVTHRNDTTFKSAEYVVTKKQMIINVYAQHSNPQNGLKNSLYIIDTSTKKKVYSDVLNESTPYAVPDSFFVDEQVVYYIKERKTLVALNLLAGRG